MVRKRSQKRYSKIESDESDSDDFYEEDEHKESPKKYSLRRRTGTSFVEEPDNVAQEQAEEFLRSESPQQNNTANDRNEEETASLEPKNELLPTDDPAPNPKDQNLEPTKPSGGTQNTDDLIDFEDVIRADYLVNTNKIDYETMIEKNSINKIVIEQTKSELKEPSEKKIKLKKNTETPKKRGRKPRKPVVEHFEPALESTSQYDNTGLPINSVLGVSESLYELAERYMQTEPLVGEGLGLNGSGNQFIITETDPPSEPIEIF